MHHKGVREGRQEDVRVQSFLGRNHFLLILVASLCCGPVRLDEDKRFHNTRGGYVAKGGKYTTQFDVYLL